MHPATSRDGGLKLQLRMDGNALAQAGELEDALAKYTEALALAPPEMQHKLHSNISLLQLSRGDAHASLRAAEASVACAPPDWSTVRLMHFCPMLHPRDEPS